MPSLKDHSRTNWTVKNDDQSFPGNEQVIIGCMQRIADATEKMASKYTQMESDLEYHKMRDKGQRATIAKLERSNAALRGHINRLKKKS